MSDNEEALLKLRAESIDQALEPSANNSNSSTDFLSESTLSKLHKGLGLDLLTNAFDELKDFVIRSKRSNPASDERPERPHKHRRSAKSSTSRVRDTYEGFNQEPCSSRVRDTYEGFNQEPCSSRVRDTYEDNDHQSQTFDPTLSLMPSGSEGEGNHEECVDSVEEFGLAPSLFDSSDSFGPKVSDALAQRINESFTKKPVKDKMKAVAENYRTPENCSQACVPKINQALWAELPKPAKLRDFGIQEIQKNMVKVSQILAVTAESVNSIVQFRVQWPRIEDS